MPPSSRQRTSRAASTTRRARRPQTLSVDVGGSHIKASILDDRGRMLHERVRVDTPDDLTPARLVQLIASLARRLPRFDRVSVGFPGVVRHGIIRTAPNLGSKRFAGFDLARKLRARLGKPVRVENDADVQGFGAVRGRGVEMVITLGTGFGTSLFEDGRLGPHIELAHHPFREGKTYEELLGVKAMERHGARRWNTNVRRAIDQLRALVSFDHLYIGGGNARRLTLELPRDVTIVSNDAGIWGGVRLWKSRR